MATLTFKGGEALEATLRAIADKAGKAGTLKVGFLEGATYPNGTSVAAVAAFNEFGTSRTPARPFFRQMIAAKSPKWGESLGNLARANNYELGATLRQMGEGIRGQLQNSIREFNSVPLAEATVARKGFNKQLIDTAVMINAVDYEVNL
jgi:hypothetical protein